mmetsp:Transcript_88182/g.189269  ORF Transcript_88182/g.189269 Transcript_88182/m.189269 type:complete len:116 (+) Transcript_88182:65-412(+)
MPMYTDEIEYSEKYNDDSYEYRHVILPKEVFKEMYRISGTKRLLTEQEWRNLGVTQSRGWVHFAVHRPEPHVLLFRRPLGTDPVTGKVPGDARVDGAEGLGDAAGALPQVSDKAA